MGFGSATSRGAFALAVVACGPVVLAPGAAAQRLLSRHVLEGWDGAGRWDAKSFEPLALADGTHAFAYGTPAWAPDGGWRTGAVRVRAWPSGELLWARAGARGGDQLGQEVFALGDLDGDGVPELLVSQRDATLVLDGATGRELGAIAGSAFLERLGDLDADGVVDFFRPRAVFLGGRRLEVLSTLALDEHGLGEPPWLAGTSGLEVWRTGGWSACRAFDDVDGDGLGDVLVGRGASGTGFGPGAASVAFDHRVDVFSSATGRWLAGRRADDPVPSSGFGYVLAVVGDLTGDGRAEVVVQEGDALLLLDGGTLATLDVVAPSVLGRDPRWRGPLEGSFGTQLAVVEDVTGNGAPELLVRFEAAPAALEASVGEPAPRHGALALVDLASGALVWTLVAGVDLDLGSPHYGPSAFAQAARTTADLDGDGRRDLAVRSLERAEFFSTRPAGTRLVRGTSTRPSRTGTTTPFGGHGRLEVRLAVEEPSVVAAAFLLVSSTETGRGRFVPDRVYAGVRVRERRFESWRVRLDVRAPDAVGPAHARVQWLYRQGASWHVGEVLELSYCSL